MFKKLFLIAGFPLLIAGGAARADVITFDSVGDTGKICWSASVDGASLNTCVDFTVTAIASGSVTFDVDVANTSSGLGTNRFMSFGIDVVSPTLTGSSDNSAAWSSALDTVLPGAQKVDLCVFTDGCAGGAIGTGIGEGGTSTFLLTLTTAGNFLSGITFTSPYSAKWQDVGRTGNSYESQSGCVGPCGGQEVPEPGSLALLGLGLSGLALIRRRRRD